MDKKQQVNTIYLTKYRKKKKLSRTSTSEKRNISFGGAALGIRNENHWTVDPKKNKNEKQKLQRARKIPHLMLGVSVLSLFAHSANCNSLCVLLFCCCCVFYSSVDANTRFKSKRCLPYCNMQTAHRSASFSIVSLHKLCILECTYKPL